MTLRPNLFVLLSALLISGCATRAGRGATALPAGAAPQELRVMSYNIHHANPPGHKGLIDLEAIARVIRSENPDLVALQEVDVHIARSGKVNQAGALAEKLGMHYFFAKAIDFGGGEYGVAILSRFPLSDTRLVTLPEAAAPEAEDRVLALATVELPDGQKIRFGSTHLDVQHAANRLQQVQTINAIALADTLPFIVAGDFNDLPESAAMAELGKAFTLTCPPAACAYTFPQDLPDRTIDYIAYTHTAPLTVLAHEVVPERYASDHLPLVARLRLQAKPEQAIRSAR